MQDIQIIRQAVDSDKAASDVIKGIIAGIIDGGNPIQVFNYQIPGFEGEIAILCKMNDLCKILDKQLVLYYGHEGLCCYTNNITVYFPDYVYMDIMNHINAEVGNVADEIQQLERLVDVVSDIADEVRFVNGELDW